MLKPISEREERISGRRVGLVSNAWYSRDWIEEEVVEDDNTPMAESVRRRSMCSSPQPRSTTLRWVLKGGGRDKREDRRALKVVGLMAASSITFLDLRYREGSNLKSGSIEDVARSRAW